jgi:hypothetical protein
MKPGKAAASGEGAAVNAADRNQPSYTRCHIAEDIPFATVTEMILAAAGRGSRSIVGKVPAWVLVKDEQPDEEEFDEVEEILVRSYQTWTDFPLFQWHRWYDWNLFVLPAPGFEYLRSLANSLPKSTIRTSIRRQFAISTVAPYTPWNANSTVGCSGRGFGQV